MRIGHGYDVHRLVDGRKLILGGVEIPFEKGLDGHSDADVLTHAVMDALLGAAALGDIGKHFPDNDVRYLGADSIELLKTVSAVLTEHGWRLGNLDATVIAQRPKLAPYIDAMRARIADALGADISAVSVKATTEEHLGFTGDGSGIAAHAVCLIEPLGAAQPVCRHGTGNAACMTRSSFPRSFRTTRSRSGSTAAALSSTTPSRKSHSSVRV